MADVKQQRAVATREALVLSASRIFAAAGYRAATMSQISADAKVTQGALYFHFRSKQDVAAEVIRQQHELSISVGKACLEASTSGIEGMIYLSGALAAQMQSNPIVQAGLRLSTESASDLADASVTPYVEWIATSRLFLEKAAAQRELIPGLEADMAAEVIISAFSGTQFVSVALAGGTDLFDRLTRMWTVLLPALLGFDNADAVGRVPDLLRAGSLLTAP
jgi:AcrR family transcriptional regulator